MLDVWFALSYTTRFSVIAFIATLCLGLLSMGMLGALLYYPASLFLRTYSGINEWHGDWVWPATIGVGMAWSLGFPMAGTAWWLLAERIDSVVLLRVMYGLVLYGWAVVVWWLVLWGQVG